MIEEIKADQITIMTQKLWNLFFAAGCKPMCHCCLTYIPVGGKFKLSVVSENLASYAKDSALFKSDKEHDVMLCNKESCTPLEMLKNKDKILSYKNGGPRHGGGCSIIDGKIVH